MSESSGHEYLRAHQISGDALLLDISEESRSILEGARTTGSGHTAKTLVREGPLRMLILGFTPGSSLRERRAGGPVSIQSLSGAVEVSAQKRTDLLSAGEVLVLASYVPHSVTAKEYSVLLLTIARPVR
jgi:quercetin dioxygenase-like cupin family protein